MPDETKTRAFVLRTVEYGDRDLIVTLFGRASGVVSAIAKNARGSERRFGGGLQPMRLLRARYVAHPDRDLARLDEIGVIEDYAAIQEAFDAIAVGSHATELLDRFLVESDPAPEIFDLTHDFFERLARTEAERPLVYDIVLRHFELRLLEGVGAAPSFDRCLRCGTRPGEMETIYAVRSGEGVVCPACTRTGESVGVVAPPTLEVVDFYRAPGERRTEALADPTFVDQARRLVDAAVRRLLDSPLKSRSMLETALEGSA